MRLHLPGVRCMLLSVRGDRSIDQVTDELVRVVERAEKRLEKRA